MILLLLGTNPYPFGRLLQAVDEWAVENEEYIIAQTGHTPTDKITIECHDFVDYSQILEWIKQAEFVICQGGFGSIKDCIKYQKAIISAPRLQEYGECQDSQKELVNLLAEKKKIVPLFDMSKLAKAITLVRQFVPTESQESIVPDFVDEVVNSFMFGVNE